MKKSGKQLLISYFFAVILIAIDQLTKYLAGVYLKGKAPFVIAADVFELKYLENTSAAFSLDPVTILHKIFHFSYFDANPDAFLWCKMIFFVVLTCIVAAFVVYLFPRIPVTKHWLPMNLILIGILSGSLGNLIDRVVHNYVIDFFYFKLIDFPVFNMADIYVTVSVFAFVFVSFFVYKEEDMTLIFPEKGEKKG